MSEMNEALKRFRFTQIALKRIDPEAVSDIDLEAEFDPELTLTENLKNLEEKFPSIVSSKSFREPSMRRQLLENFEAADTRSRHAKRIDRAIKAARAFSPKDPRSDLWFKSPNRIDVIGVDTPTKVEKLNRNMSSGMRRLDRASNELFGNRRATKKRPAEPSSNNIFDRLADLALG